MSNLNLEPGIHLDIPWADYKRIPYTSPSLLKHGLRSMKRLKGAIDGKFQPDPKNTAVGNCVHAIVSGEFDSRYVEMPAFELDDWNLTKGTLRNRPEKMNKADGSISVAGQKWLDLCKEHGKDATTKVIAVGQERTDSKNTEYYHEASEKFLGENEGKEVMTAVQVATAKKAVGEMRANPAIVEFIRRAKREVTVIGTIHGVRCKTRLDLWRPDIREIGDIKTTNDIEEGRFYRHAKKMGYFFQFGFHVELMHSIGEEVSAYQALAVEVQDDYDTGLLEVPMPLIDTWRRKLVPVFAAFVEAGVHDRWDGMYEGGKGTIAVPNWDMTTEDDLDYSGVDNV